MTPGVSRVFRTVSHLILVQRGPAFRWGFAALSFAIAVSLRWTLNGALASGFPFLTFFPAIILTAFFCGRWPGIAVSVASFFASWLLFVSEPGTLNLSPAALTAMGFFAFIAITDILLIDIMTGAVQDLEEERRRSATMAEQGRLMFHELQHRVSNNLATVAGLLSIQRRAVRDEVARKALDDAVARINAVSRMKRLLHDPTAQEVDFGAFLKNMTDDMIATAGAEGRIGVTLDCPRLAIPRDHAVPLGLIATELLSNAIEHGFAGDRSGRIALRLSQEGGDVVLRIEDDGHGLPDTFRVEESSSLGLTIARQFAQQMGGRLRMAASPTGGTLSELVFPKEV
ncbi:sensor histidine kinase [Falsirhodobacter sp. 20TX0035]|uniref:sensor histidine kinase n=1 Tax=Falsirhodobacter sp. 20TX0035 TaxID=3022019 RepID=UPI00232F451F|nr:histidine kinase dimerization/phosphoacceptor domain -containing protein [Falsirhodobacter sp. 20TX0035]MDB6454329.1 histidine kinase dimerization/phosphoacceptor domain -containing protein [Falsirhodobacter sp. 20TX0035]